MANIGIDYGQDGSDMPSPQAVVKFLQGKGVKKIRLYHTYTETMKAFENSGIQLILQILNEELTNAEIGKSKEKARKWVEKNVKPYIGHSQIKLIAVGNEVTASSSQVDLIKQTVPAMQNIKAALDELGYKIQVSTPLAMDIIKTSWPPSAGAFRDDSNLSQSFVDPLLQFLASHKYPFLINIYPFFTYKDNPVDIKLDYALMKGNQSLNIHVDNREYKNLLQQQLDAVYFALERKGHRDIPLLLSETGWPSAGHGVATPTNAAAYNQNLINFVKSNNGLRTPYRPQSTIPTYIFALFNENMKGGQAWERNFGLFKYDSAKAIKPVYNVQL